MGRGMRAGKKSGGGGQQAAMQKQMQQIQAMQQKMEEAQAELETKEITATAGGGVVSATVNGKKEITRLELKPEVVDPDDIEMLQDLIMAAVNEALRQIEELSNAEMNRITGAINFPGM
ncbi:MAG TPA: YbaB/EbfC family nucleoid-associated protein [Clostridiales bacterium]|nr:YbaB/EbfC family nucleoid-associated protein [Clostridiales bacterium]